jgi:uncharacterized membrane protein YgcG
MNRGIHPGGRQAALRWLNQSAASLPEVKRGTVLWALAALLGLVLTAAVTWAASQLASQHIGLSSEPLSVANGLAPRTTPTRAPTTPTRAPTTPMRTSTTPTRRSTSTSTPAPVLRQTEPAPATSSSPSPPAAPSGRVVGAGAGGRSGGQGGTSPGSETGSSSSNQGGRSSSGGDTRGGNRPDD